VCSHPLHFRAWRHRRGSPRTWVLLLHRHSARQQSPPLLLLQRTLRLPRPMAAVPRSHRQSKYVQHALWPNTCTHASCCSLPRHGRLLMDRDSQNWQALHVHSSRHCSCSSSHNTILL
jgi:hypothetical protein